MGGENGTHRVGSHIRFGFDRTCSVTKRYDVARKHKRDLKTPTKSGVVGIGDEVGCGLESDGLSETRLRHRNSYISVKKESDRRKDGTRLARKGANVAPSSLVQFSGRGDILSTRQRHPDSACSRNLQMKFAYSQLAASHPSAMDLWRPMVQAS